MSSNLEKLLEHLDDAPVLKEYTPEDINQKVARGEVYNLSSYIREKVPKLRKFEKAFAAMGKQDQLQDVMHTLENVLLPALDDLENKR